jgi:hypothetical protein
MRQHLFSNLHPRLSGTPLLLTPGVATIGYVIGGRAGAWWGVAAWLAIVLGASVSCVVHAWREAHGETLHAGRRAFDYDPKAPDAEREPAPGHLV